MRLCGTSNNSSTSTSTRWGAGVSGSTSKHATLYADTATYPSTGNGTLPDENRMDTQSSGVQ